MIIEKAKTYFLKYPELKALFIFDPEKEYQTEIEQNSDSDFKIIICDKSLFSIKYQLEFELAKEKVFLYFPYAKPNESNIKRFILLDLLVANKELLIDDVADFMEEFGLKPNQHILAKKYIKDLKIKKVQRILAKILNPLQFEERAIIQGLLSNYLGFSQVTDKSLCLVKLLILTNAGKNKELNLFNKKVKNIDSEKSVCQWFQDYLEFKISDLNIENIALSAKKLKYNVLTMEIHEIKEDDPYQHLKINKAATINLLQSMMIDWQNDAKLVDSINPVFEQLAGDIKEETLLKIYGFDQIYGLYTEALIINIFNKISSIITYHPDQVIKVLKNLRNKNICNEHISWLIDCFYHTAYFYEAINSVSSFILNNPGDYIANYVNKHNKIDFYYRKAADILKRIGLKDISGQFSKEEFEENLHKKYEEYLKELNTQWQKCLQENSFNFNNVKVDKQYSFYEKYIRDADQKTVVIISDALRYEAANELLNELHSDAKSQARIFHMLTGIPSNTSLGMANLLPNKSICIDKKGFSIEGISTEGLLNRQKILQIEEKDSRTVHFSDLEQMNQVEARELFKRKVVYVYHNVIDAIGDDRKTENQVYSAVAQAIEELKTMIKKIHSSWNVSRVLITADHGFIFHQRKIPEAMYEKMPKEEEAILAHNRFCIIKDSDEVYRYIFNLKSVSNIDSDLQVIIPHSINRFKRQGSGVHFVHGGATLQEIVVPVIESSRKREAVSGKVELTILNRDLAIISGAIKVRILQKDPIGESIKGRSVLIGLYNASNELISNETDLELAATSELPTGRTKEIILNLTSKAGQTSFCYLQIFDKQDDKDKLNPLFKEKVINKSLIESDF